MAVGWAELGEALPPVWAGSPQGCVRVGGWAGLWGCVVRGWGRSLALAVGGGWRCGRGCIQK